MKKSYLLILLLSTFLFGCKDDDGPQSMLLPLTEYEVTSLPGGGKISYSIPNSRDISYILAEYERKGQKYTERSSIYKNYISVEGFSTLDSVKVTLYTVNRQEEKSDPLVVCFKPLEAPIVGIQKSLKMLTDFGGITACWTNKTGTEIGVRMMATDDKGILKDNTIYYSYVVNEQHAFRGFGDTLRTFAISFEDKWGNISDTSYFATTPYYETEVAKPFALYTLPYDNTSYLASNYNQSKMWDNVKGGDNGYLTKNGSVGTSFTIDLKQQVKLSRVITWPRYKAVSDIFGQINIYSYEMWGTDKIDQTKLTDTNYWLDKETVKRETGVEPSHTFQDDWTYLGKYNITRPDVGQGSQADADLAAAKAGFAFSLPLDATSVRYIRFYVRSNAKGEPPVNNYYQVNEISFFGNNKIPQY